MKPKGYVVYRDAVLAKTPPEHIHTINGKLGVVLNSRDNMEFWIRHQDFEKAAAQRDASRSAELDIQNITGIRWPGY